MKWIVLLALCLTAGCTEKRQIHLLHYAEDKLSRGETTEAISALKKAIALNPEGKISRLALFKLGFALETYAKDPEGALFYYQEFSRLTQDPIGLYEAQKRMAGIYFEKAEDPEKSITAYRKLMSLDPKTLEGDFFQLRIAESLFQQNKFDHSREEYQQLIEKYPKSQYLARARYGIANTYYMDGKYQTAMEAIKQVFRHHEGTPYATEAQFLLASCLENSDRLKEALAAFESLRDKYPSRDVLDLRIQGLQKRIKEGKIR